MSVYQDIFFKYSDTNRAAVGLTIVLPWRTEVTDSQGRIKRIPPGTKLTIKRGKHHFSLEVTTTGDYLPLHVDIEPSHWPKALIDLKDHLNTQIDGSNRTRKQDFIDAANRTLQAFSDEGDIDQLTLAEHYTTKPNNDNPHIILGALLPSMAISRLFTIDTGNKKWADEIDNSVERDRVHATKTGIHAILLWLRQRQHPSNPGYFFRWHQTQLENRDINDDWLGEPSLDEYSGLLMGLSWMRHLTTHYNYGNYNQWSSAVGNEVSNHLANISNYLVDSRGWLVRPNNGDLNVRGPDLVVNSYPMSLILRGMGLYNFRNAEPLNLSRDEKEMIERSEASLARITDQNSGLAKWYSTSLKVAKSIKDVNAYTSAAQWAGVVAAIGLIAVSGGIGAGILSVGVIAVDMGLIGLGVGLSFVSASVAVGAHQIDEKIVEMSDAFLWDKSGAALGKPLAIEGGGYNTHIFDRFSLGAFWASREFITDVFAKRATRRTGGDDNGWMSFGIGARIWMGTFSNGITLADRMLIDIDALMPNNLSSPPKAGLRTIEGFVLGWSMIALALDLDPEIEWEKFIKPRFKSASPREVMKRVLPRFTLNIKNLKIIETREHGDVYGGEEPYFWIIPILFHEKNSETVFEIMPHYHYQHYGANDNDVININKTLTLGIDPIEVKSHLLVVAIGWEQDFTTFADRAFALQNAVKDIEYQLTRWDRAEQSVAELGQTIEAMLNWQLPHYYQNPEAQPGYRKSDDDFVGAAVAYYSVETNDMEKDFSYEAKLSRNPKPAPKFTIMKLIGNISFKNIPQS